MTDMHDMAYDAGFSAYYEGVVETDNPYDDADMPDQHTAWNDGWLAAQEEDTDLNVDEADEAEEDDD